jgi:hypothetical protein
VALVVLLVVWKSKTTSTTLYNSISETTPITHCRSLTLQRVWTCLQIVSCLTLSGVEMNYLIDDVLPNLCTDKLVEGSFDTFSFDNLFEFTPTIIEYSLNKHLAHETNFRRFGALGARQLKDTVEFFFIGVHIVDGVAVSVDIQQGKSVGKGLCIHASHSSHTEPVLTMILQNSIYAVQRHLPAQRRYSCVSGRLEMTLQGLKYDSQ